MGVFVYYLHDFLSNDSLDEDIISDVLWALSYSSDLDETQLPAGILLEMPLDKIIQYLSSPNRSLKIPALRIIGNISTLSAEYVDNIMKKDIITHLIPCLQIKNTLFQRETLWVFSNIAAGPPHHVQQLLDTDLINIVYIMVREGELIVTLYIYIYI